MQNHKYAKSVGFDRDTNRQLKREERINSLVVRINDAANRNFTGTLRFEINFSQGGIRTIKTSFEDIVKF